MKNSALILFVLALSLFLFPETVTAQKLTVEELIIRHLDSIGTREKRDAVKNRFAMGTSRFESKLPSRTTNGKAILVSEANNLFFVASFNSQEYPFEKIGFFANKASLPFVTAGARSPLGAFIADHNRILSDGLFAGSVSTNWSLLNPQIKADRFKMGGTKKVNGCKAFALDYFPGGSSPDFTIKLFFDAENFRHLRTEYRRTVPAKDATFGTLGEQTGVKIELTEDFGDFKKADDLTLPYSYKLHYMTDSNSGVFEYNWGFTISEYLYNQTLEEGFFSFDEK